MESTRNDYGERCQFDAYCKLILYHESIDYLREMKYLRDHEVSWSDLSPAQENNFSTTDQYCCEDFNFSSHGCTLRISNEIVADAFSELSDEVQTIFILHLVLGMTDQEVGDLIGKSRYAVMRRRNKALRELRIKLSVLIRKGVD